MNVRAMPLPLITDDEVRRIADFPAAVSVMQCALERLAAGTLAAPARVQVDLEVGKLVFTTGAATTPPACLGFRVYDQTQLHSAGRDELTAVFDNTDGALKGIVIGPLLGAVRTGAIGGVAVNSLSRSDARVLGILGAGYQARTQLRGALAVRDFADVRVYSRSADGRRAFAKEAAEFTSASVRACESARDVVEAADVLICATASREPVLEADWLKPGVHINTIGPKFHSGSELGLEVAQRSGLLVTDSLAQAAAFGEDFVLHGTPHADRLVCLSKIVTSEHPGGRSAEEISLFYSLGLAGTEVLLADRLIEQVAGDPDES